MHFPTSLKDVQCRQECIQIISAMDGWDKIKHFSSEFGMAAGMGAVLFSLDFQTQGLIISLIILPIGILCAVISYALASLAEFLYERIFA